jgi:hypothetical protein
MDKHISPSLSHDLITYLLATSADRARIISELVERTQAWPTC